MDRADCSNGDEIGVACVKLSGELKGALGLTASKFSKFVKLEALAEQLKKLSIHLPALETCKCEVVLVKADELKDQLQIFLNESKIEREICKGLQELATKKAAQNEETREKDESATSSPVLKNKNLMGAADQGWICLGSDAEIIQSHAPKQRPLLAVEAEISRMKKSYKVGELKKFDAKVASFHASKEKVQVVERKFMDACTQAGESIDAEAQTLINFPKDVWTQWSPQNRDFDAEYSEEQTKHLKEWVQEKANLVLDCAHHNCILENHVDDFQLLMMSDDLKREFITEADKEYILSNIISSFNFCQGVAIAYAWHPSYKNFLAISYGNDQKFAPADEESSVCDELSEIAEKQSSLFVEKVVIWDCDAKMPKFSLTSSSIVECLLFSPEDERLLLGGCHNGDIRIWKLNFQPREQNSDEITVVDPFVQKKSSSRKSIIGVHWLDESNQFVTVSVDGCIVIWILEEDISIRETGVKYSVRGKKMFIVSISRLTKIARKSLKDGEKENVFKLLVGSQGGTISVFEIDTKPKEIVDEDDEEVQANAAICLDPSKSPNIHDGPVADIRAAPLEENIHLSVGGHVFAIFTLGRESCPIFLKKGNQILSSCAWSCFSKNLFYICTTTGKLQVWNLLNAKSNLEAQFCFSPGYIRDLSSPESQMRNGILHLTDDRGSIMFCQIPEIHQVENKSAAKVFLKEMERINLPGSIALPAPEKSLLLAAEVKKRQEILRIEEERLNLKMASLIKPERREVLVLREKQASKDKATRLEATRRLQLLDELPKQLLGLKGIDMKRLTEFEEPMLHLQRRDKRRSILREARVRADSDF